MGNPRKRSREAEVAGTRPRLHGDPGPNAGDLKGSVVHTRRAPAAAAARVDRTSSMDSSRRASARSSGAGTAASALGGGGGCAGAAPPVRRHFAPTSVLSRVRLGPRGRALGSAPLPRPGAGVRGLLEAVPHALGSQDAPTACTEMQTLWEARRIMLEAEVAELVEALSRVSTAVVEATAALEEMLAEHHGTLERLVAIAQQSAAAHGVYMRQLGEREDACRANRRDAQEEEDRLVRQVQGLCLETNALREVLVMEVDRAEGLQRDLAAAEGAAFSERSGLEAARAEAARLRDAVYGVSSEARGMAVEMEQLQQAQRCAEVAGMEAEVVRRELYATCEDLKGSIRVYCRVKGSGSGLGVDAACLSPAAEALEVASGDEGLFSYPTAPLSAPGAIDALLPGEEHVSPRTICVHQVRPNATSTGTQSTTECFSYDRVFSGHSTQEDVYREVEPLVHNAVDGYRVCIFAYGQTGSGKTYTIEGDLSAAETYGVMPRALETILRRQEELGREGWVYTLSCSLVEIYNDVVRDLLQSPATYELGGTGTATNYHAIKHGPHGSQTTIDHTLTRVITSMEDFRALARQALLHRRTAKTRLNDRSSRSHCIFTLRIDGRNDTIRQRSEGVLCLIDLAGSERVNESGAQGQQLREAININRSLLDLGKCISALRGGAVVPWRNSRLTYYLQHYLGGRGAKILMVLTISNRRAHVAESLNSLRFARNVSETVIGSSVKRVSSF